MLLMSTFPAEEIEKERGVILEEIDMVYDTPDDLSQDLFSAAFWKEHSLGRTILGPRENVQRFTREDVTRFVSSYYVAENTVISICGNISRKKAIDVATKFFSFPARPLSKRSFNFPERFGGRVESSFKDIEQSNVTIEFPALSISDPNLLALSVISNALGGGMSSILFQEVREKLGLVYSIYDYLSTYEDVGAQCIYLGTNPKNLGKAMNAIRSCLDGFCRAGMDEECFHRAKQQIKGGLIMGGESSMSIMRAIGKYALLLDRCYDIDERLSLLNGLDLEKTNALIPRFFDTKEIGIGYVGKETKYNLTEFYK